MSTDSFMMRLLVCGVVAIVVATTQVAKPQAPVVDSDSEQKTPAPVVLTDKNVEELSALAALQLEVIARILRRDGETQPNPDGSSSDRLAEVLSNEFTCTPLRPAQLQSVFKDDTITVERSDSKSQASMSIDAEGFASVLQELTSAYRHASNFRADFNIYDVVLNESEMVTRQFFSLSGHMDGGSFEQHATWKCTWTRPGFVGEVPRLRAIQIVDYEQTRVRAPTNTLYSDWTQAVLGDNAGFNTVLMRGTFEWLRRIELALGPLNGAYLGLAVGDVTGDGLDDLYVTQPGGLPNQLYIQNADGTATERGAEAGVNWSDLTTSVLFIDLDNDDDQDLVLGTAAGLLIMSNDGSGQFELRTLIHERELVSSLSAADYDHDGDLDIYACRCFPNVTSAGYLGAPEPLYDATTGAPNYLIRNDGDWQFSDVTVQSGLDVENRRWTFAASWEDYDNDGDQDLYLANDYGRNCLFRNDRGQFEDVTESSLVADIGAGKSVCWADYNGDGHLDLYVGNTFSMAGSRVTNQSWFHEQEPNSRSLLRRLTQGGSLMTNRGNGTFQNTAIGMGRWTWGSQFVDLNRDGWEDLVVANGYISSPDASDQSGMYWQQVIGQSWNNQSERSVGIELINRQLASGYSFNGRERHCVFLNLGGAGFANISASSGLDMLDDGRAVAYVDWDHDGDLDLWMTNRNAPQLRFLRNDTPTNGRFLKLHLRGQTCNRDAIGARVEVSLSDGSSRPRRLVKTLHAGEGFLSQSTKWLQFGLSTETEIEEVVVRWPGGESEIFRGLKANHAYRITQSQSEVEPWPETSRSVNLEPAGLEIQPPSDSAQVSLAIRVPIPGLIFKDFSDYPVLLNNSLTRPTLIVLWATSSESSVDLLRKLNEHLGDLAGINIIALSMDGLDEEAMITTDDVKQYLRRLGIPFDRGMAEPRLVFQLQILHDFLIYRHIPVEPPTSFLIDSDGDLAAFYDGPISIDILRQHIQSIHKSPSERRAMVAPIAGQWAMAPNQLALDTLGRQFLSFKFYNDAVLYLREAIYQRPKSAALHVDLANALNEMGKTADAAKFYRRALALDPRNPIAHYYLGVALRRLKQRQESVRHLKLAIQLDPSLSVVHRQLGFVNAEMGNHQEAIRNRRRFLELRPESAEAQCDLGTSLHQAERTEEAVQHFEQALRIDPNYSLAHFGLARALAEQGEIEETIKHYYAVLNLAPQDQGAKYNLAVAFSIDRRYDVALNLFHEIVRRDPTWPRAQNGMAWILATHPDPSKRDPGRAIRRALRAAGLTDHNDAATLDTLATAYAANGEFEKAQEHAIKAMELAMATKRTKLTNAIRDRLELYKQSKPYISEPRQEKPTPDRPAP